MTARRQQAFDYFVGQGWSPAQASGIVANLVAESNLNPAAVGDGGLARGIAQWHPDRQDGFLAEFGKPITAATFEEQLAWVQAELQGREKAAATALRECTTAAAAGACVSERYERPADRQGEAQKRAALAERIFAELSGAAIPTQPAAPIIEGGRPMLPAVIAAVLPSIIQSVPAIASIFAKGERGKDNVKAMEIVAQVVTDATKSVNVVEAAEKLQADPEMKKVAQDALLADPVIASLLVGEAGGGIKAAREYDLKVMAQDKPFWRTSAVFWVSMILLPLIYWLVGSVIAGGVVLPESWPWYAQAPFKLLGGVWNGESRSGIANLVIGLILGGICGVYYGVSVTQNQNNQRRQTDATPVA